MKKYIPDLITCCNFLCGCVATYIAASMGVNYLLIAFAFILAGAVFDFFDGMTARALNVSSPIGKELDSLADATTFGLAPSAMALEYINHTTDTLYGLVMLVMAAFSIIRLAKFNLDERQTSSFIGLATPANAIFWASLSATLAWLNIFTNGITITMIAVMPVSCYLLISEIPFFSLKFHNMKWQDNRIKYIFLIGSALILIAAILCMTINYHAVKLIYPFASLAVIIVWYVMLVAIDDLFRIIRHQPSK